MPASDNLRYIQAYAKIIGVREKSALEYAERKGITALLDNAAELLTTPAQREKHQAFLDLYRMSGGVHTRNPILDSPEKAADFFRSVIGEIYDKETFVVAFLDTKLRVSSHEVVSVGSVNVSLAHPREVFRGAIINKAASVIFCHNHPSGEVTPSQEDINLTKRLKEAGELLGIPVLDHVIIGGVNREDIFSFKSHNVLERRASYRVRECRGLER